MVTFSYKVDAGMFPAAALSNAAEIIHSFKLLCKITQWRNIIGRQMPPSPNRLLSPHPLIFLGGNDSSSLNRLMESKIQNMKNGALEPSGEMWSRDLAVSSAMRYSPDMKEAMGKWRGQHEWTIGPCLYLNYQIQFTLSYITCMAL